MHNKIRSLLKDIGIQKGVQHGVFLLVGLYIFMNPFPHITAIQETAFYTSAAYVLVGLFLKNTAFSFRSPLSIPFTLFVAWSLIGLPFALDRSNSLHDIYAHLIKYIFLYYLVVNLFNTPKRLLQLVWLLIISAAIFAAGNLAYFYGILGNDFNVRLGLEFDQVQTNLIGTVTVLGILLSLQLLQREKGWQEKLLIVVSIMTLGVATLMTQTKSALIAFLIGVFILFWRKKRALMISVLVVLVVIMASPLKDPLKQRFSAQEMFANARLSINLVTLSVIKDYPVFGIGFGMQTYGNEKFLRPYYEKLPPKYASSHIFDHPHNIILDTAVRVGLIGLGFFLLILYRVLGMSWKVLGGTEDFTRDWGVCLNGCFVAILVQGMFEPTLDGPPAIVMFIIMAMITVLWKFNCDRKPVI